MGVEIHQDAWPIVVMRVHDEFTMSDVEQMIRAFQRAFEREGKFVTWMDARDVPKVPAPATRRAVAEWMRSIEAQMQEHCVGSCNLIRSPIIRGVITAIYWIYTPPVPQGVPANEEEGRRWCAARLREGGVDPEAALAALSEYLEPPKAGNW